LESQSKTEAELPPIAIRTYREDEIIIESFLDGTEVSVGVINYKGEIVVLPIITEIVSETTFFDYEAKYQGSHKRLRQPASLMK
jgi:D-alanine-D-alanine ligase